jgi:uncharacterized protein (DUF58 family)
MKVQAEAGHRGPAAETGIFGRLRRGTVAAPSNSAQTDARRIYILPTGLGVSYGAILTATLLGALNYQNNLALFLCFLMISASLVSMHQCWFALVGLRMDARDGVPVFQGQTGRFTLLIGETKGRSRYGICADGMHCGNLPPLGHLSVEVGRPAERRGRLLLGEVKFQTSYPLGLFRAWTRLALAAELIVYPRPAARAPEPRAIASFVHHGAGDLGTGADDFVGLRPYRTGDSPRQLDWKALARERGLIVKQFGGDRAARVWIDWDQVRVGELETRLGIMTRQVLEAHEHGLRFGLRLPGVTIEQGAGDAHKHLCLRALACFANDD